MYVIKNQMYFIKNQMYAMHDVKNQLYSLKTKCNNNNNILYSSQREIEAVVRSHN